MSSQRKTRSKRRSRRPRPSRPLTHMTYSSSWIDTALVSDSKTNKIGHSLGFTIQNSSEYSVLASLFTQVRLKRFWVEIIPVQSSNGSIAHGFIEVGTNGFENSNLLFTPTSYTDTQNLDKKVTIPTVGIRAYTYVATLPKNLAYTNINADCPSSPTPFAGSPGSIKFYGENFTASTAYFQLRCYAIWELRGRQ